MSELTGKQVENPLNLRPRAVVVGASSGIGEALARKLAKEGYQLALLARRQDRLDKICAEINQAAGEVRATAYQHDVTDYEAVPALFRKILQQMQTIDLFVYNSGVMYPIGLSEYDFKKDLATLEVNLLGGIAWLGEAATLFDRLGKGHLVGVSSVAGDRGRVGNPPYHAAKSGMSTYLEALRNRLAKKGVHVLTVKPGYVQTDLLPSSQMPFPVATPESTAEAIYSAIRRGRQVLYTPWWWRYLLLVITHIPSFIFRRMSF
ncbi:MAG: SDR family NAD(P)-dependent oxidoreductase [Anaerolineales bacterium]|nr:SDR family NAD(P)-dependent oxidoreductase [Anaerolineales bacterium]